MIIGEFINEIKKTYDVNVEKNIVKCDNGYILYNDKNFDFFQIFVENLWGVDLDKVEKFVSIGTTDDNNIFILEKYYPFVSSYYAVYDFSKDAIILNKKS